MTRTEDKMDRSLSVMLFSVNAGSARLSVSSSADDDMFSKCWSTPVEIMHSH